MTPEQAFDFATMIGRAIEAIRHVDGSKIQVHRVADNLIGEPCVLVDWRGSLRSCSKADIEAAIQKSFRMGLEATQ